MDSLERTRSRSTVQVQSVSESSIRQFIQSSKGVFMYLQKATSFSEVVNYGISPLLTLMDLFEDEIIDDLEPGSKEYHLWIEIKGKALVLEEVSRKILDRAKEEKLKQPAETDN